MNENTHNADGSPKTPQELLALHDRQRARYLAGQALEATQALGKAWVVEGVGFDQLIDAQGYAALSLRRSHLRYAWLLDLGGGCTPGVWMFSVRGLEWCGDLA